MLKRPLNGNKIPLSGLFIFFLLIFPQGLNGYGKIISSKLEKRYSFVELYKRIAFFMNLSISEELYLFSKG
jgi:hypothetical protein